MSDYFKKRMKELGLDNSEVDANYINSFLSDASNFLNSASSDYGRMDFDTSSSIHDSRRNIANDLRERSFAISRYLDANKDTIDEQTVNTFKAYLDEFDKAESDLRYNFYKSNKFYSTVGNMTSEEIKDKHLTPNQSKAETEDDKPWWEKLLGYLGDAQDTTLPISTSSNQAIDRAKEAEDAIAYTTQDGKNVTWQKLYDIKSAEEDLKTRYQDYSSRLDWREKSQGIENIEDTRSDYDILFELSRTNIPYDRETAIANGYDEFTVNDIEKKRKYISEKYGVDLYSNVYDNVNILNSLMNQLEGKEGEKGTFEHMPYMTSEEKEVLNYIFHTEGRAAALEWHNSRKSIYQDRANEFNVANLKELAKDNPFWASVGSVALNLGAGVEYVTDLFDYFATGEDQVNTLASSATAIRGGVSESVDWKIGNWDAFDFIYNTGMSMADSVTSMVAFGNMGGVALGLSAAASATEDALKRGLSTDKAFWNGLVSGVFEGLFETYSISNFKALKESATTSVKELAKNIGKSMLTNASEETLTEIANIVYDTIANGDFSNYETTIRQYMNAGMSESDAKMQAAKDLGWQVVESGASGALMGFGFGAVGGGASYIGNKVDYNAQVAQHGKSIIDQGGADALRQLALEMSGDKDALNAKQIGKLAKKVESNASAGRVGKLSALMGETVDSRNRTDIQNALQEKGLSESDAKRVSEYLNKASQGYEFSDTEASEVEGNDNIIDVLRDVVGAEESDVNKRLRDLAFARQGGYSATEKASVAKTIADSETATGTKLKVSEDGKTTYTNEKGDTWNVNIKRIASTDGGLKVELEDGNTVSASDLSFSSSEEALMYEMVARMEVTPDTANEIITAFKPTNAKQALQFMSYAPLAYQYGKIGNEAGLKHIDLPENLKRIVYNRGGMDAILEASEKTPTAKKSNQSASTKKNGIIYENGYVYDEASANELQKTSMAYIEVMDKMSSALEIHVFESKIENGKRVAVVNGKKVSAPNGYFQNGNQIYIDINAGSNGEGAMLYTMSHEITHFIRQWNAKGFKELGDFLIAEYGKKGVPVNALIERQKDKIKKRYAEDGKALPSDAKLFDMAYEELVADAMSDMFADERAYEKLAKLKEKNRSVWQKLGEAIKALLDKLKGALGIYKRSDISITPEARYVREFTAEAYEKLQDLYLKAFVEAEANYEASADGATDLVEIDANSESVSPIMNSERTWTESEYVTMREEAAKKIAKALDVTKAKALKYIDDVNSIARMIANDRARLDYEASSFGSAFVSNVEYGGSFDYTTLCKKRRLYTGTFTEIQKRLKDIALTPDDILTIRNMLIEAGVEATCGLCYVEGSRANMGKFAKEFIRLYKRDNPLAWIPNMADVNTPDGVEQMRINHPEAYEQYVFFWNHYGKLKDSDPALFASQQKPKLYEARKEYKGEILEHFKGDTTVAKKNRNGGIRMQSFSDFEIVHLIDTMQVIMDMSTVGLAGQAYTKVPEFAKAFGNTGLKINLSLIAKGVDANGNLILDDREGMPHKTAFELRERYSKNVGTIIVVFTDEQLLAAMADSRIDFIIPFHRSQWKKGQYGAMGLPKGTKDYTFMQNEKLIKQTYHEYRGKMVKDKASNYMPNEYWDFSKSGKENAEAYLKMCAENNKRPKFYKLLDYDGKGTYSLKADGSTDGYWKLLIDFKMYDNDGIGSPQEAVTPTFNMDEAVTMLNEYKGGHASYPVSHSVVDKFVEQFNENNGTQYSDRDGNVKKATELSEEDLKYLLEGVQNGVYANSTYIPLRRNTPEFFIGVVREHSKGKYFIEDYPMASTVEHLRQNMEEDDGESYGKHRPHGLSIEDIITISKEMGHPSYIVLQENGRYAEVVSFYNKRSKKVVVAIDVADSRATSSNNYKYRQYMNGYNEGYYNIIVTQFEPDSLSTYLENNTVVYDKMKMNGRYQVGSGRIVTVTHDTPFIEDIIPQTEENVNRKNSDTDPKHSDRDSNTIANDFLAHIDNILKGRGEWYTSDVVDYIADHPELDFIRRIYAKDKAVKGELDSFLKGIDNTRTLDRLSWFIGEAYSGIAPRWGENGRMVYPYQGAIRTFRNAIKRRTNEIMTAKVNGTNLGLKNHASSLEEVKGFFNRLNSNEEIGKFAEKVFATAEKLGVNIRFVNQTFMRGAAGNALGDMVEYKTSYFNDTAVSDQRKASTILHELIHSCTVYVMHANQSAGDVYYRDKSQNYEKIANMATRLNRIFMEIKNDPDFKGEYGTTSPMEMVAELANERFVGKLKQKNLWEKIVDWICELFGFKRGTSAYENAKMCVDFIIDNPEVSEYKAFAAGQRRTARREGYDVFGKTIDSDGNTMYSERDSYAPTFYSHMGKVIDAIRLEKMGANGVVPYLKGKGVKDEEIKWSGIEAFLEGKKSVTKAELQEFVAGGQLRIEEEMSGVNKEAYDELEALWLKHAGVSLSETFSDDFDLPLTEDNMADVFDDMEKEGYDAPSIEDQRHMLELAKKVGNEGRWSKYKLSGGNNYRELVFKMPKSSYSNDAMKAHWGQDAEGVLAHARIQDMTTSDGKKMLFIEEIQSDWHNEGQKKGYDDDELFERQKALKRKAHEAFLKLEDYSVAATGMAGEWETIERTPRGAKLLREYREIEAELKEASDAYIRAIPDAPFRSTYHEYVLKRLLRMAAEEGYDSIGWTTADIQSKRWSDNYAEGYRIEYDQDIPKFLRKYGKKWGATVGKERIGEYSEQFEVDLDTMEDSDELLLEEGIKYDGVEVWSMDIPDSMKDSVLHEGQVLYSDRDSYTVSNRTLLANALESVAQTDIERNKLAQYKAKIALIEKAQAQLEKIRAEANTIRFTKGRTPDETKRMRELDAEATRIANRISTYDKQLLNLESTTALKGVLEREKAMLRKRLEQKGKEAIKAQKEKAAKTQRELMTRYQESRAKAIESRNKTEMRHKIKNVVSDLNKLLLHPTKEQHIPIGLQLPVAEALDAINMDTMNAEERVAYYNDLIARTNDPDEIDMLTRKRDFFEYRDANFKDRINALKNAYAEFKKSDDPLIRNAHNEAIEELIENTADFVGKKSLKDMSLVQLEAVYRMYKAILATVRNSNRMFKEGRQATVTENSEAVKTEVKEVGGHQERVSKLVKAIKLSWNHLKPVYAFERIGSKRLTSLFDNVRKGEETYAVDIYDAKAFFQEKTQRYNYNSWDFKKMYSFNDSTGNSFSLSLEQIMSLYAYSKREQADRHLEVGGFVFDDAIEVTEKKLGIPFKYEVNDANPYRLRKEDLLAITATLTTEQKGFIDEMQTYLSDVMGAKGNEVSLAMYDIKLYNEKNYFPLKTSRYFRDFNPEQSGNPMLRNSGFSKKTVPQAGNPIVLANFMDVWMSHVNDMSMYHSFVLPLEDFMRVYNYSSTAGGYDSVQQYIKNAYGAEANQYIEKLMQDINGGVASGSIHNGMLKMFGKFKKAAVAASLSTIVQQPTAIIRAMALINPKYFVGVPFKSGFKRAWEEMKRHAPITIIKEMGGIDVGSGRQAGEYIASHTYKGLGKIKGFFTDSFYRDSIFMWGAGKADELGWISIWNAVKREVASKQKLKQGTDEFFKACGERFSEVITHTQVYDSVFSRSGLMRDKGDLNKFATSFMGEPTTSFNMIYGAILKAKRGGSKAQAVREITSVYVSIIGAAAMASLIYALRDDDEDESYLEKWAESLGNKISSEVWIHNMLPYWRDIASILEGWDIERPDMSIFSDIKSSFDKLFKINEDGDFEWKVNFSNPNEVYSAIENFGGSIASAFGLPLKNFMRDTRGIFNGFEAMFDDVKPTDVGGAFVEGFTGKETPKSEKLYEAIVNGDKSRLEIYKKGYKTEDAYESAIRKALRENDTRIAEAAQAKYDGNISEYTRIAREIIAEGNFSQDTVVAAINAQVTSIKNGEKTETKPTEDKDEVTSIYSSSDINTAFDKGNNSLALQIIDDLVKTKVANGKTEKEAKSSIRSSMTSHWKPLYKEAYKKGDSTEMARIRKILNASGVYGTANEVVKTTQSWLKD